jgi:outer membrane lipoprotein-sorting protein
MMKTMFPPGRAAAILALVLVAAVLAACAPQPATQAEVAGERATPQATVAPTPATAGQGTPAPATGGQGTPATATPAPGLPGAMAGSPGAGPQGVQSFEGELRISVHPGQADSRSVTMAHWFKQPDLTRLEVLEADGFDLAPGSTLVSDGTGLTVYDPAANQVTRIDTPLLVATYLALPSEGDFPAQHALNMQQLLAGLGSYATFTIDQTGSVAGRAASVVTAMPTDQEAVIRSVRLWIDQATGMPLRLETRGEADSVLMSAEYSRFDPAVVVADDRFSFDPPAGAQLRTVTPEDLAGMADFQMVSPVEARQAADFQLMLPQTLPAGVQERETWMGTFHGRTAVVTFYGTADETSTALVQTPAEAGLVPPRGAERIDEAGFVANAYEKDGVIAIEWVEDGTHLTLVSTQPRDQLLEMARSVR